MKIIVNKTFNNACFKEYLNCSLKPNAKEFVAGEFKIYDNATTGTTVKNGVFPQVLFVPKSFLDIIDVLNTREYAGTLDIAPLSLDVLLNTLYNGNKDERNLAIDFVLGKGLITSTQASQAKTLTSSLGGFVPANMEVAYNNLDDVYSYSFNTPVELNTPYDVVRNVGEGGVKDKLFLVMLSQVNISYGDVTAVAGGTGVYSPLHKFYNPTRDTNVRQASYIATEMGDINDTDVNPDLKYDHMDKIDYIDSFRLRFKLPRVIA